MTFNCLCSVGMFFPTHSFKKSFFRACAIFVCKILPSMNIFHPWVLKKVVVLSRCYVKMTLLLVIQISLSSQHGQMTFFLPQSAWPNHSKHSFPVYAFSMAKPVRACHTVHYADINDSMARRLKHDQMTWVLRSNLLLLCSWRDWLQKTHAVPVSPMNV